MVNKIVECNEHCTQSAKIAGHLTAYTKARRTCKASCIGQKKINKNRIEKRVSIESRRKRREESVARNFCTSVYQNNIPWVPRYRAYEHSATYTPVTYVYIYFWIKNPEEKKKRKKNFKSKFGPRRKPRSYLGGSFLDARIVHERTKIQAGKRMEKIK